jgi:uncharacterized protein YodC (DUF2158 family)
MTFQPGDIVSLKSGGLPMTVAVAGDEGIECIWIGDEGELFRETLPAAVLKVFDEDAEDDADDEEDEEAEDDEAEGSEELRKSA